MEIKATLNKPYTDKQKADFIVENNHNKGYEIQETDEALLAIYNEPPAPTIDEQNEVIRQTRQQLFEKYADPLKYDYEEQFAKYGADNETTIYVKELWLNKKEEIRQQNPYIEEESGNI